MCTLKSVFKVAGLGKISFGTKSSNYKTIQLDWTLGQCLYFTDEHAKKQRNQDTCQGHKPIYQDSQD